MKRLNKKGFTLVELLAVIVVLAIIMVIATQAIGNVIKKNTISSFKSSLDMVAKQAKQADTMASGTLAIADVRKRVDYDAAQYDVIFGNDSSIANRFSQLSNYFKSQGEITEDLDGLNYICLISKENGKFHNMDESNLETYINIPNVIGAYCNLDSGCSWGVTSSVPKGTTVGCRKFR